MFLVAGGGIAPPTSRLWAWRAAAALSRDEYPESIWVNHHFVKRKCMVGEETLPQVRVSC